MVVTPPGQRHWTSQRAGIDDALTKAIARAHRWSRMLEAGEYMSLTELAAKEGVTESYLARILRLNLLSPTVVEAILDGTPSAAPQLQKLLRPFPIAWNEQEVAFGAYREFATDAIR